MEKITNIKGELLEGCVWDEHKQQLYFVDILCRKIYCLDITDNRLMTTDMPDYVSCIVLDEDQKVIAALPDGLYCADMLTGGKEKIFEFLLPKGMRCNDGKCDAAGRLWVGSMAIHQSDTGKGAGSLFCIEKGVIVQEYSGYSIPNGLAWDDKSSYFYHIDTPRKRVDRYLVSSGNRLEDKRTAVDLRGEHGSPDGMCMDAQGNLWIAMWDGGKVVCADPRTGSVLEEIQVPDRLVSCCTFGGNDMDILYITTASDEAGNGGHLYMQDMQVKGKPVNRYRRQ